MKNEFARQAIHIAGGIIYAALFLALPLQSAIAVIAIIFTVGVLVSDAHRKRIEIPIIKEILSGTQREDEKQIPGKAALEFTLGVLITSIIFFGFGGKIIAGAILVLGIGDGASTLAGKAFGKTKIFGNKTLEGTIGGIIPAALALLPLFPPQAAITAAIIGMLAEYLPINDNYSIPIAAATILAIMA